MDSQVSKKIEWCLRKAERELNESEKQNKKPRHRGLLKINPDKNLAFQHVDKARHFLKGFRLLRENDFSDLAMGVGFYSLYHCFLSITAKFGYESKNQTCTITLIDSLQEQGIIDIKKEILDFMKYEDEQMNHENSVIELREDYTYGVDLKVRDEQQLDKIEKLCLEFIDITQEIIYKE
ncbi:hypothetical protein COU60_02490 [Candidatus Pacearchaeota archaeon CG10_big_fil_rev_8_21_14_0_10_34_76]|nr:MAG: hypothetical protein COU60_02490 [Candidatus Pacearchaeota archaeon CG10_big_fil_rev_8_21_14_0_10_34_76]